MAALLICFWMQDPKRVQLVFTQMPVLTTPLVLKTRLPLLAAALLMCCSYLAAQVSGAAGCHATCIFCCVATPGRLL